jgi:hypothetical protein
MGKAGYCGALAACLALTACGGGGGVNSAGSTATPGSSGAGSSGGTTPPPTNTNLSALVASQAFTNDAVTSSIALDTSGASPKITTASATTTPLAISYDAGAQSYTVTVAGRTQSFGQADVDNTVHNGLTNYRKATGGNTDLYGRSDPLLAGATSYQYVAAGYWQRNSGSGSPPNIQFDAFTYGFPTAASAAPRTGKAAYLTQLFGLIGAIGKAPITVSGNGTLSFDLVAGAFAVTTYVDQTDLGSSAVTSGGNAIFAAGRLSSSDATLSGNVSYFAPGAGVFAGVLAGRLYGPNSQELGMTFNAGDGAGGFLMGTILGQVSRTATYTNQSLVNLVTNQSFLGPAAETTLYIYDGTPTDATAGSSNYGGVALSTDGTVGARPIQSIVPPSYGESDKIAGRANFDTYKKTEPDGSSMLEIYKPGSGNTELALTYSSIASWSYSKIASSAPVVENGRQFYAYGIVTSAFLTRGLTGSAHYAGIAFGAGINRTTFDRYDVTGTSTFDVDFGARRFTSAMTLSGRNVATGMANDFGGYSFTGGFRETTGNTSLSGTSANGTASLDDVVFYGPSGQELAGSFSLQVPAERAGAGTTVVGVVAVKR